MITTSPTLLPLKSGHLDTFLWLLTSAVIRQSTAHCAKLLFWNKIIVLNPSNFLEGEERISWTIRDFSLAIVFGMNWKDGEVCREWLQTAPNWLPPVACWVSILLLGHAGEPSLPFFSGDGWFLLWDPRVTKIKATNKQMSLMMCPVRGLH